MSLGKKRVCVDVGATFTDCLVLDGAGNLNEFKAPAIPFEPFVGDDRVIGFGAGGGGVGNLLERDPVLVGEDVRNELVSLEAARDTYGIVVDPETFVTGEAATAELRRELNRAAS